MKNKTTSNVQNRMLIEIEGVYDGVCVIYYPKARLFEWEPIALTRTTRKYREDFELQFLDDLTAAEINQTSNT